MPCPTDEHRLREQTAGGQSEIHDKENLPHLAEPTVSPQDDLRPITDPTTTQTAVPKS